jgi:hypothetical protein
LVSVFAAPQTHYCAETNACHPATRPNIRKQRRVFDQDQGGASCVRGLVVDRVPHTLPAARVARRRIGDKQTRRGHCPIKPAAKARHAS